MTSRTILHRAFGPIGKGVSLIVLAVVTAFSACVATQANHPFNGAESSSHAWVQIENDHVQDMRISVIRHGTRISLGRVGSMTVRTFRIAALGTGAMQLQAEPIPTGTAYRSVAVILEPGRGVHFRVAPNVRLSTVVLR